MNDWTKARDEVTHDLKDKLREAYERYDEKYTELVQAEMKIGEALNALAEVVPQASFDQLVNVVHGKRNWSPVNYMIELTGYERYGQTYIPLFSHTPPDLDEQGHV